MKRTIFVEYFFPEESNIRVKREEEILENFQYKISEGKASDERGKF